MTLSFFLVALALSTPFSTINAGSKEANFTLHPYFGRYLEGIRQNFTQIDSENAESLEPRHKRFVPPFFEGLRRLVGPGESWRPNIPYVIFAQGTPGVTKTGAIQSHSGIDPNAIRYQNGYGLANIGNNLVGPAVTPFRQGFQTYRSGGKTIPGLTKK